MIDGELLIVTLALTGFVIEWRKELFGRAGCGETTTGSVTVPQRGR